MTASRAGATPAGKPGGRSRVPLAQRRRARRLIVQALYQWLLTGDEPHKISEQFKEETEGRVDWEYFDAVFVSIPKQASNLDACLQPVLDREISALDPVEKALLYLGCFELSQRIDIPYRVVINECVELAKAFGASESHKYINGVLDKLVPGLRAVEYSASS